MWCWISLLSLSLLALSPENRPVDIFAWPCLILPRSKHILFVEGEGTAGTSYIVSPYLGVLEGKQWCFCDVEVEQFSATATHTHTHTDTHIRTHTLPFAIIFCSHFLSFAVISLFIFQHLSFSLRGSFYVCFPLTVSQYPQKLAPSLFRFSFFLISRFSIDARSSSSSVSPAPSDKPLCRRPSPSTTKA